MHTCLTYFYVDTTQSTNFDAATFVTALGVDANYAVLRDNGGIRMGQNQCYNVDVNAMARQTLAPIWDKRNLLAELKNRYNLTYYLVRVPHVYANCDAPKPLLSLAADVVDFLHQTGTIDDLDYYTY